MTSHVTDRFEVRATKPGRASGIELPVPAYAQNLHKGQFPEYGGGGENWGSPTSTEMVAEHWGKRPKPSHTARRPRGLRRPARPCRAPPHLRLQLRWHRKLAVQHRVCGEP